MASSSGLLLSVVALFATRANACTTVTVNASDGTTVIGRTMELGIPLTEKETNTLWSLVTTARGAQLGDQMLPLGFVAIAGAFHNGYRQAPYEKVPLIDIHGTQDKQVPCNSSTSDSKALSQDGWWYQLLALTEAGWLEANGCKATTKPGNCMHEGPRTLDLLGSAPLTMSYNAACCVTCRISLLSRA